MADLPLPPSLSVVPNIPLDRQTLGELRLERDYWLARIEDAECWGAALKAAYDFCRGCEAWIARREEEQLAAAPWGTG